MCFIGIDHVYIPNCKGGGVGKPVTGISRWKPLSHKNRTMSNIGKGLRCYIGKKKKEKFDYKLAAEGRDIKEGFPE